MARHTGFSHSALAKLWLEQTQDHAKGKSMSFKGRTLISYSTPIALLHPNHVALISNGTGIRHSVSTSMHLNHARRACRMNKELVGFFVVPSLLSHSTNLAYFEASYRGVWQEICDARATTIVTHTWWDRPYKVLTEWRYYCETFGYSLPDVSYDADKREAEMAREKRLAAYNSPRQVERRLRAKAKRDLMRLVNNTLCE